VVVEGKRRRGSFMYPSMSGQQAQRCVCNEWPAPWAVMGAWNNGGKRPRRTTQGGVCLLMCVSVGVSVLGVVVDCCCTKPSMGSDGASRARNGRWDGRCAV
jgi:hypothetical protein